MEEVLPSRFCFLDIISTYKNSSDELKANIGVNEMKFLFGTIDNMNIGGLDMVLKNMLEANEAIKNNEMSKEEIVEYIKAVIKNARMAKYTDDDLFWGFDEPSKMDGDSRVYYFYNPTYYTVIFMISAYMRMPKELEAIEGFMDTFRRGLDGSTGRNFYGHGYEQMSGFRSTMKMFLEAETDVFVEKYPYISERFTSLFVKATSYIRDMVDMHITSDTKADKEYRFLNAYSLKGNMCNNWTRCWVSSDIDLEIRDAIISLNKKGYTTVSCCAGHPEDVPFEFSISTYIYFADKYSWLIEPPFIGETKGIRCKMRRNGLYWETRRRVKSESKRADHEKIINSIYEWVDKLPNREG